MDRNEAVGQDQAECAISADLNALEPFKSVQRVLSPRMGTACYLLRDSRGGSHLNINKDLQEKLLDLCDLFWANVGGCI